MKLKNNGKSGLTHTNTIQMFNRFFCKWVNCKNYQNLEFQNSHSLFLCILYYFLILYFYLKETKNSNPLIQLFLRPSKTKQKHKLPTTFDDYSRKLLQYFISLFSCPDVWQSWFGPWGVLHPLISPPSLSFFYQCLYYI